MLTMYLLFNYMQLLYQAYSKHLSVIGLQYSKITSISLMESLN